MLRVKKYDPQAELEEKMMQQKASQHNGKIQSFLFKNSFLRRMFLTRSDGRRSFPSFIHKTDEVRIQLLPNVCADYSNDLFGMTEKLDGQSATYFVVRNKFWSFRKFSSGVCSRNYQLSEKNNSYWRIEQKYNILHTLSYLADGLNASDVVLQGEIIGEGIQENKYGLNGIDFYVFNLFTSGKQKELPTAKHLCELMGFHFVPVIKYGVPLEESIDAMVQKARGMSCLADVPREGIVVRNLSQTLSFKVINPDFLLKFEE